MGWPLRGGRGVDSCFTADQRRCFGGGDGWPLRGRRGVDWRFAADKRRCFGGGGGWPLRGGRGVGSGFAAARLCGCAAFFPGRAREGPQALSCFNRTRRRVRRVRGNIFGGELAPRRRNCFLSRANGREGGLPPDK